jgi:hypothetical protein
LSHGSVSVVAAVMVPGPDEPEPDSASPVSGVLVMPGPVEPLSVVLPDPSPVPSAMHHAGQTENGLPYFVMEHLRGRTLESALSEENLLSLSVVPTTSAGNPPRGPVEGNQRGEADGDIELQHHLNETPADSEAGEGCAGRRRGRRLTTGHRPHGPRASGALRYVFGIELGIGHAWRA